MFKQAEYNGRSKILRKMREFTFSQDGLDVVRKIGPSKFIRLAKSGKVITMVHEQYKRWFVRCPESVREIVHEMFSNLEPEANEKAWLAKCCLYINLLDLKNLIDVEPEWYEKAPKVFKFIMDKAFEDQGLKAQNTFVDAVYADYLIEAVKVAEWADLL